MKNIILFMASVVLLVIACTPKASPAVTEAMIPSETTVSNDATTIKAGQALFATKCTQCHKEKPIHKWTYEKQRRVLGSMVQKAKLDKTEIEQVCAYVHANSKK